MSTSKSKVAKAKLNSFGKEVLARLVGDNNEVLAQKITRKAMSALTGQVASNRAALVDAELELENAQERFADALYPSNYPQGSGANESYCKGIIQAQAAVDAAQDAVDDLTESTEYFEALVAQVTTD